MKLQRRSVLLAALATPAIARAQAWPAQTIRLIHGYDAGSNPDTIARHLSGPLTETLGQQIVIEPRPGAAERLAATQVARMKPDGYSLYLMTGGQAVVSATDRTLSYDLLRDFEFISIVTRFPFVFTVAPDSRFKTVQAYVDEAKRSPGTLTYGTSGVGSTLHMAVELVLAKTGAKLTHVPYKGGLGQPYNDLVGGRLDMHVITFSNAQPFLKSGKLRAIAVTSKERHPGFPDVPTLAETLVPDYDVVSWLGFTSPAGLPPAVCNRLHEAFKQAMARPEIKSKLEELGNDTRVSTPAEFRARVEADMARWRPLAHVVSQS
ncbi:tripartite tricarboxylate transporter substrate binding protein [Reyranella sp.]|uniref:Bug family tripartite tricarboxylate transporter substrate binding protein n=1 Tax=Reyranella sp. TaxID=1929291 RepID=UPI0012248AEA|nr:tripartite tricarboxylate transporter substrate binding protein [Reyranella sp.]TAJ89275.1 MAG: tripartite tricarboxylate transporter substrate binding protein [Reyranella sp.]